MQVVQRGYAVGEAVSGQLVRGLCCVDRVADLVGLRDSCAQLSCYDEFNSTFLLTFACQ